MNENEILKCIETVNNGQGRERDKAMSKIMEQFQPYMYKAVSRMDPTGGEDAMSAAIEGLYHAVTKYKPESGNRFFTYAYNCISGYIGMSLRNGRLMRIPNTELKRLRKQENRDEYSKRSNFISLNTRVLDGEGKEIEDFISYDEDFDLLDEEEEAKKAENQEKAVEILKATIYNNDKASHRFNEPVHSQDGMMFCMMYGILGSPKYSAREISKIMKEEKNLDIPESTVISRCRSILELVRGKMKEIGWAKHCVTFACMNNSNMPEWEAEDASLGPLFGGPQEDMPKDYVPDMTEIGIKAI